MAEKSARRFIFGRYAPTGQIVWHSCKGKHGTHSFALSELFSTADEAKVVARRGEEGRTEAERRLVDVEAIAMQLRASPITLRNICNEKAIRELIVAVKLI